jgi:hypothetical protein
MNHRATEQQRRVRDETIRVCSGVHLGFANALRMDGNPLYPAAAFLPSPAFVTEFRNIVCVG